MRFGLVHRVMTDALAALGVLALVASGQFTRGVNIAITVALVLAISMNDAWRHAAATKHADTISVFALFAAQLGRLLLTNASLLDLLIEFAVGLQIIRVATRKGAAHDQQVIVLALLHLIAGTVVGGGLGYGLCFFGLLVVTPGALVLSHLRREVEGNYRQGARDRTGLPVDVPRILRSKRVVGRQFIAVTCLLSVPILLFTVSLFIIFPRVGLSLLLLNRPKSGRMIGFSGKVDLGQIGTLREDNTVALRVTIPDAPNPPPLRKVMHLRGTALDHYDGRTWTQSLKRTAQVGQGGELIKISGRPQPGADPVWLMDLEPIDPPVLFITPNAKGIRLARGGVGPGGGVSVHEGAESEVRYQAPNDRGVHYELFLAEDDALAFTRLSKNERGRYLQLPHLPDRIPALADDWLEGVDGDMAQARAIENKLRTLYTYDLSSPSGEYDEPLDHFLFESKRGHCEYYSTAMAVMLRTKGIPSRNVTGFVGGTYNRYGEFYAVRQGDAHSWVEAYIEGRGWVTFDPTPPAAARPQSDIDSISATIRDFFDAISQRWNHHVLGYDLRQQVSLFESLSSRDRGVGDILKKPSRRTLLLLVGLLVILLSLWWLRRRAKSRTRDEPEGRKRTREEALATSLYQHLDQAMSLLGIARSSATPPLRHALALVRVGHPQGEEILDLTQRYLDARFGHRPLEPRERREFEQRIRQLRESPKVTLGALPLQIDRPVPHLRVVLGELGKLPPEETTPPSRPSRPPKSVRPSAPPRRATVSDTTSEPAIFVVPLDDFDAEQVVRDAEDAEWNDAQAAQAEAAYAEERAAAAAQAEERAVDAAALAFDLSADSEAGAAADEHDDDAT